MIYDIMKKWSLRNFKIMWNNACLVSTQHVTNKGQFPFLSVLILNCTDKCARGWTPRLELLHLLKGPMLSSSYEIQGHGSSLHSQSRSSLWPTSMTNTENTRVQRIPFVTAGFQHHKNLKDLPHVKRCARSYELKTK